MIKRTVREVSRMIRQRRHNFRSLGSALCRRTQLRAHRRRALKKSGELGTQAASTILHQYHGPISLTKLLEHDMCNYLGSYVIPTFRFMGRCTCVSLTKIGARRQDSCRKPQLSHSPQYPLTASPPRPNRKHNIKEEKEKSPSNQN